MPSLRVPLAIGLTLIVVAIAVVLSKAPMTVARTSGVAPESALQLIRTRTRICQGNEVLPRETSAIVAWLGADVGPRVSADVTVGGRVVTRGERGAGWTGRSVVIPVRQVAHSVTGATVCFALAPRNETAIPRGLPSKTAVATSNGKKLGGTMSIEYLQPGSHSWWSRASSIAYHVGLGRDPSGTWAVLVAVVLAAAVATIASGLAFRELR
jgi:hypothetical protein